MGLLSGKMGVKHWIFQRVSNALIVVFGIALVVTLINGVTYESLQALMASGAVKVYLLVTLVFAVANSILAGWQIAGDYAKKFHLNQGLMVGVCAAVSVVYLVVGLTVIF